VAIRTSGRTCVEVHSIGLRKEHRMSLLWIILIVVLVLALLGFFGRGRF
jgi:flagellar basal body-associated protein FliL